jgi:Fe2+ transport system protein FeoA
VPAAALVAAAKVSATSIDQLLALARRLDEMGLRPGD